MRLELGDSRNEAGIGLLHFGRQAVLQSEIPAEGIPFLTLAGDEVGDIWGTLSDPQPWSLRCIRHLLAVSRSRGLRPILRRLSKTLSGRPQSLHITPCNGITAS